MTQTPACLGGWCKRRERCEHYLATDRPTHVERICDKGHDGETTERRLVVHRPAGDWQTARRPMLVRPAHPFGGLSA